MARDHLLEELIRLELVGVAGIREKTMFGGLAWLLDGHLLCAASHKGMLARLGKGEDGWALALPAIETLAMRDRAMPGWVRATPEASRDDAGLRQRLVEAATAFVRRLPPK
jgi:hypothetical protein